ncbi:MAG: ppa [Gammaproteobacteria bacterium]|jgi:inorganic pyrophosphatase|nr:ppa [Gammaproteobacteria bacterium]
MNLEQLPAGHQIPDDINVVIEIASHSNPIKYEVDKNSGMLMVDRFIETCMHYPCEYGFIPQTLSEDGDPVDVLVVTPFSLAPGVIIRCRPVGMLLMTDESGIDTKILAVPVDKLSTRYQSIHKPEDLGIKFLASIEHFFQHYKDLEKGKWVKTNGWENADAAKKEILAGVEKFKKESGAA